jgi:hypothetical protein
LPDLTRVEQRFVPANHPMSVLQFTCDYCGDVKEPGETWINGVAAENVGTQAARREVIIDPAWRRERAVSQLAVHFCCRECKDKYMAELFNQPASMLEVQDSEFDPAIRRPASRPNPKVVHKRTSPWRKTGT